MNLSKLYRWCDSDGGGLVYASSVDEAREKLAKAHGHIFANKCIIWPWLLDDYYDVDNPNVLDIYGL